MSLLDVLRRTGARVEKEIVFLNHGGCCVYAAAVSRVLLDAGIPAWGIVYNYTADYDLAAVRLALRKDWKTNRDWYDAGAKGFGHVMVGFNFNSVEYKHDSLVTTSGYPSSFGEERPFRVGELTVEEMERLTAQQAGWKKTFNWNDRTRVRNMVNKYLGAYLNSKRKKVLAVQSQLGLELPQFKTTEPVTCPSSQAPIS